MNFFKRKFSFSEDEGEPMDDVNGPPSSFSFHSIANKVSNTISAPTSPAKTRESLAAALERSLNHDRSRGEPAMKDAKVLLVIDSHHVDWSKYFRNHAAEFPIRVEQGDIDELDVMCTEKSCVVELNQVGRDVRTFTPAAVFIGAGATRCAQLKTIVRAFIAAHIPFLNSHTSAVAFLDKNNLKKQLKKITLPDGASIPMLPIIHYPHFHKFQHSEAVTYPMVISVNEGFQGIGKIKVNSHEELCDVEGMLQIMAKGDTEVEVQPYVDAKYDLHIQKIGHEYKTFIRRGICKHWKSNVGSSVLEQINTNERHKKYIQAIIDHVGHMQICSIDILVSKEGREFVHDVNDVISYFGESGEDDRRAASFLLRALIGPKQPQQQGQQQAVENGTKQHHNLPPQPSASKPQQHHQHQLPQPPHHSNPHPIQQSSSHQNIEPHIREYSSYSAPPPIPRAPSRESISYVDDTMGQLKRTFAGFFGE